MISGTNCEWTVDGAPRLWHRVASCGPGISLHTKPISHISLFAGSHKHSRVRFSWNALESNLRGEVSKLSSGTVIRERSCYFYSVILIRDQEDSHHPPCFLPCWDNFSLSLITIAGQRRACTKRWCHWIASPLFLLCKQPLCNIQVWLYCPRCNYVCARVHVCVRVVTLLVCKLTDHSLYVCL